MIFTTFRQKFLTVLCLLLVLLCAGTALSEGDTLLTVELRGITPSGESGWNAVSLSGVFEVRSGSDLLGSVAAAPSADQLAQGLSDQLTIPQGVGSVTLTAAQELDGFVFGAPTTAELTPGAENRVIVFAYAERGLFSVRNTCAGQAVGPAEFVVLDAQGGMALSFATDENGLYTSSAALPAGVYQLAQMRSADGTLPRTEPVSFEVSPYFGNASDIAAVEVENEPIPGANPALTRLAYSASPLEDNTAQLTFSGLCDGTNAIALSDFTLTLGPADLLGSDGAALSCGRSVTLESLVPTLADGTVSVQALDADGQSIGDAVVLESGQGATFDGAYALRLTYLNAEGQTTLQPGFLAGTLRVLLRYTPVDFLPTEPSAAALSLPAQVTYAYEYPDTDGSSIVRAQSNAEPLTMVLEIPDGRIDPAFSAVGVPAEDGGMDIDVTGLTTLPDNTPVAFAVPGRFSADGCSVLRTEQADYALMIVSQPDQFLSLHAQTGVFSSLTAYVYDPRTLPKTLDNPEGFLLRGEHQPSALLDTAFGYGDGQYVAVEVPIGSQLSTPSAPLSVIATGTMAEAQGEPAANQAVLVQANGLQYGSLTDENGAFTVYGDAELTSGRLFVPLPANTMSEDRQDGLFTQECALPVSGVSIRYSRMGLLSGRINYEDGKPVPDVTVTLGEESMTTDIDGAYRFEALSAGDYALSLSVPSDMNAALLQEDGTRIDSLSCGTLSLGYGEEREMNFSAVALCSVGGTITEDGAPVSGLSLSLGDRQMETDENGHFYFGKLDAGSYALSLAIPDGKAVISAGGEAVRAVGAYESELTLAARDALVWDAQLQGVASVRGEAGTLGGGASVAAASLYEQRTAVTEADGSFAFEGLAPADYTFYVPLRSGDTLAADSLWRVSQQGDTIWLTVAVEAGHNYQLPEIRFVAMTSVSGLAFMDQSGDGVYQSGEQLMTGVPVTLQISQNGAWTDADSQETDEYGAYAFRDLAAGVYRVVSQASGGLYVSFIGGSSQALEGGARASSELTLAEGDNVTSDVALAQPASLKAAVFVDSNENGERGEYERAVSGATVELTANGQTVATGVTDASGLITLSNVAPGFYQVRFLLPDGYLFTAKGAKPGLSSSSVSAENEGLSDVLTFAAGQTLEASAGVVTVGSFSGRVWSDENNDGVMQAEEPGMAGVKLTLSGTKTGAKYELTTDETGVFRFARLRNDTYNFTAVLPEGLLFARYTQTGGDSRSVFTVEGSKASRQFVVSGAENVSNKNVGVIVPASLAGTAFLDLNYNGIQDEGEPAYQGVTLEAIKNSNSKSMGKVTTGADGAYVFTGLRGGDYRLRAILPDDGSTFTYVTGSTDSGANQFAARDGRRENSIPSLTVNNGQTVRTVVGVARGATLSGVAFQDAAYDGVQGDKDKKASGVKVQLTTASGELLQNTTTNANGKYAFEGVMPGEYVIRFQRKNDMAFTRYRPNEQAGSHVLGLTRDGYGETEVLTVVMGQNIGGLNAGMLPSSTVTGTLFDDANDNGVQDEGELGYTAASVRLYSEDAEIDLTESVGENGAYFFDGVMPGTYTLNYLLPNHAAMARVAEGGNTQSGEITAAFTVEMGKAYSLPLAGALTLGSLEGVAFHDINANGVQDEGEEVLSGVLVTLTPDHGEASSTASDASGRFGLDSLRPASYKLTVELPQEYIVSSEAGPLLLGAAQTQTIACPWSALISRDSYGLGAVRPATITGYVWLDENKDGAQSDTERLMNDLSFELVDEARGKVVQTAISDAQGRLTFANVRPATYTIRFAIPAQAEPAEDVNSTFTRQDVRMVQSGIALTEGASYSAVHCGLVSRTSIGGTISLDVGGARTTVEGVTVELHEAGALVASTVTGENGAYRFDGLWPDEYHIEASLPEGMVFVRPNDPNYAAGSSVITQTVDGKGRSDSFQLLMAQHRLQQNIVYIEPARVGDMAWLDSNANGLVDEGEPMLSGVTIHLVDESGAVASTTQTNAWGYYEFADVYPGTYTLRAIAYPELDITQPVPALRLISSCLVSGDGNEAVSDPISVVSGSADFNNDLGYVLKPGASLPAEVTTSPTQDWSISYAPATDEGT
ncbi:MAG: SdrD B-like domain-containing protein, partial [Eubacteriales bacterium]|nr:SdrD B-like domain-containing protein [Eubacteriales bacterium]